jgi:hypothetical protein
MGSHWLFFVPDDQLEKARQVIQALDLPDERGTAGGLLLGGALGDVTTRRGSDMRGLGVALAALEGAGIGALGGTIYGAFHGIVTHYEFQADTLSAGTP